MLPAPAGSKRLMPADAHSTIYSSRHDTFLIAREKYEVAPKSCVHAYNTKPNKIHHIDTDSKTVKPAFICCQFFATITQKSPTNTTLIAFRHSVVRELFLVLLTFFTYIKYIMLLFRCLTPVLATFFTATNRKNKLY